MPAAWTRRPLALLVGLLSLYGGVLAFASPESFPKAMTGQGPLPYLSDRPVGEDGFYMLTVAWHLGRGDGLTYNHATPTTGVQPLMTVVLGGLAALVQRAGGDRWDLVRATILLGVLLVIGLAALIGGLARSALPEPTSPARRDLAAFAGAALTLGSYGVFRLATYGLETGLYLVALAAFALYLVRALPGMAWQTAGLAGLLAGLCGLARIDFGVVLGVTLGVLLLRRQLAVRHALALGATALACVAPWFLYVHSVTGSWLPSSGPAQARPITEETLELAVRRGLVMAVSVLDHLTPWAYTGSQDNLWPLSMGSLLVVCVLLWLGLRRRPFPTFRTPWVGGMIALGVGVAVVLGVYVLAFWAAHFYERYAAPLLVIALPLLGALVAVALPHRALRWSPVAIAAGLGLSFGLWAGLTLHRGTAGNQHAITAGFVHSLYPDRRVGTFQSGVVGYFNPDVVNLDGKVDPDALAAARADALDAYIDAAGVEILLDWEAYLASIDSTYRADGWTRCAYRPNNWWTECYERR